MNRLFVLFCLASACKGTFLTQQSANSEAYIICIYSKDPVQFEPKCFNCVKEVYTNALQACVNGTTMPSNITYSSANCMEKNCKINYPKEQTPAPFDSRGFFESLGRLFRTARSVEDNKVGESSNKSPIKTEVPGWKIIDEISTFASDFDLNLEFDYTT